MERCTNWFYRCRHYLRHGSGQFLSGSFPWLRRQNSANPSFWYVLAQTLVLHYTLAGLGLLPDFTSVTAPNERAFFQVNYQLLLNVILVAVNIALFWLWHAARQEGEHHDHHHDGASITEKVLKVLAFVASLWLIGGLLVLLVLLVLG